MALWVWAAHSSITEPALKHADACWVRRGLEALKMQMGVLPASVSGERDPKFQIRIIQPPEAAGRN